MYVREIDVRVVGECERDVAYLGLQVRDKLEFCVTESERKRHKTRVYLLICDRDISVCVFV